MLFQLLFGESAKLVRHGTGESQCDRSISDGFPSEALTDPVYGAIRSPTCHASLAAGAAAFILEAERQFQLHVGVLLEVRDGDRQQRDLLLARMIREHLTDEVLGNLREYRCRRNRRIERQGARDRVEIGEANADGYRPPRQGLGPEPRTDPVGEMA